MFNQTQHPFPPVENALLVINANGTLDDERSFKVHVTLRVNKDHRVVHVDFGH